MVKLYLMRLSENAIFNIPETSLGCHFKGMNKNKKSSRKYEEEIIKNNFSLKEIFIGFTTSDLRKLVFQLA